MPEDIKKNPWIWVAAIAGIVLVCVVLSCLAMFTLTLLYGDLSEDTARELLFTAWESRNSG
ncbi:MAG: hypothetical protein EA415_10655 [Sphaerobacteraceae bacterium]|nr:MAG: hypothetical protein EA415_10655 [Sphaerobacteraceae bacterium]